MCLRVRSLVSSVIKARMQQTGIKYLQTTTIFNNLMKKIKFRVVFSSYTVSFFPFFWELMARRRKLFTCLFQKGGEKRRVYIIILYIAQLAWYSSLQCGGLVVVILWYLQWAKIGLFLLQQGDEKDTKKGNNQSLYNQASSLLQRHRRCRRVFLSVFLLSSLLAAHSCQLASSSSLDGRFVFPPKGFISLGGGGLAYAAGGCCFQKVGSN